jgi:GAF domain-containing protein
LPYDPAPYNAVHSLIEHFAALSRQIHASEDFDESLNRLTATTLAAVGGAESVSISLLEKDGPITRGATHQLAYDGDQIQYDEHEGPCLDAALEDRWVSVPDLAADSRWPTSAQRIATELGIGSMFSCRLALDSSPRQTLGGINLYSTTPGAFTEQDQMLAILLASLGAVVIDASRQQQHLRAAIASRQVIGEAIGILRSRSKLSSQQAFDMLVGASQRTNTKLRDLAQRIADGTQDNHEPPRPMAPSSTT